MKSVRVVLPFLLAAFALTTGTPSTYAWSSEEAAVSVFGGSSDDVGNSIAVDSSGNLYTTGYFEGTVDFDPGAGTSNLTSAGSADVFVSKLDSSGNFVWAKSFGGSSGDRGYSIAVDSSGNVYTTGFFVGTVDFDPGAGTSNLTSAGSYDVFVSKLNSSGNFVWAKSFGGSSPDAGYSIAVDSSGNLYATGAFQGTADFDPGAGTSNLTSAGGADVFVSKLDSSGNLVWAKGFGGSSGDVGNSIAVDSSGNLYATGDFYSTVDFDPGAGTSNLTSAGGSDVFVSKLDSSGNLVWAKSFGGSSPDIGYSIAVDGSGNVYTTGFFEGTADFDPGAGTSNLGSAGGDDVFVSKLDSSGALVWAKSFGGSSPDAGYSIAVDSSGNLYTTGYFVGTVDFDPGAGTSNLTSAGSYDVFVLKLTSSGEALTDTAPGAPGIVNAVATGTTTATVGFTSPASNGGSTILSYTATSNPGGITATITQAGSGAILVTGLSPSTSYTFTVTATNAVGTSLASAASNSITTSGTGIAPLFTSASSYDGRFTVQVTNYDSAFTYAVTSSAGQASINSTGLITVTGLRPDQSVTVTVTTTRTGYASGSGSITGRSQVAPMLPTNKPIVTITDTAITCTIGSYSATPTSAAFSLFVDGKHVSTIFSAVGDYLPDWIIPWATSSTITRTASLTSATWAMSEAYIGKSVACITLAYSMHATGMTSSLKVTIK